ncbi:hemerythrin domain-containing protein [Neisseria shayeganii]|uniref:Hemerythrin HHE cation binding domain protein n=1 Tax=Neisseria shayeganii 871 TaxID=1032488 RepID=G4CKQ4_9NEIS|nr:hemerythrin domain-containing protein [Neisseria shayeganii]EGY51587.1 hemerythrin HHE cation binding domain protein [Neisseria shayeganii 871]
MKRHPLLIPLSQDHHHSLALCLRILRDPAADHRADIAAHQNDLLAHFAAEEAQFAPLWAALGQPELQARFNEDHARLRAMLAAPAWDDAEWKRQFAETLREHARFEERVLFPALTPLLPERLL